jgi:hypothetical protein
MYFKCLIGLFCVINCVIINININGSDINACPLTSCRSLNYSFGYFKQNETDYNFSSGVFGEPG